VDALAFEHHLVSPQGHDRFPRQGFTVVAGGGECCDRIEFSVEIDGERVTNAGFRSHGCGAALAAGSAAVTLARGRPVLDAARLGASEIADELGGLSPGKLHAAELAADALARALGGAVRARGSLEPPQGGRTLVAMSGGVDSTVAALLTRGQGEAIAVTLELWSDPENDAERSCCSASAVSQARRTAHSLDLPHFTIDLRREFRVGVVDPFIAGYAAGVTPNPCVGCNGHVRLDALLELADRLGCETLATGHYARLADEDGAAGAVLRLAADVAKDQTYMLCALDPGSLARMRFPLGNLTKPEVRRIAAEAGLAAAGKPDSQDLCFLAGTDRARFLARHGRLRDQPGPVVDREGNVLTRHRGQHRFTVGQRRGLGVSGAEPMYVLDKDASTNRVTVGPAEALKTGRVALGGVRLHRHGGEVDRVKLRYRAKPLPARLADEPGIGRHRRLEVELSVPADVAAPGQVACLLAGDRVVGWGTIVRTPCP
jgi:tRNA-uridine 2-sulfurtransferase